MRAQQDKQTEYAFWRAALRGEKQNVQETWPQCGFYRRRWPNKEGPYYPVAIFWKDGQVVCGFQGKIADPLEHWTWVAKNPIEEHIYRARIETGKWPDGADGDETRKSNMPAHSDPFEAHKFDVDDKLATAQDFFNTAGAKIADKTTCDRGANIRGGLMALLGDANTMFKVEKAPVLKEEKRVGDKYRYRDTIEATCKKLLKMIETFMTEEEARLKKEAAAKHAAEVKAAEAARLKQEEERKELEASDLALAHVTPADPLPKLPLAHEPVKINAGGGAGRRVGLKTEYVPEIFDYPAALKHFQDFKVVKDLIESLVKASVRASKGDDPKIPGVRVNPVRKAA